MLALMERGVSAPDRGDLLGRVFHGSSQGLLIARGGDGTIVEANDAFMFLLGSDRDEGVLVEDPASGLRFWQGLMLDITEAKTAAAHHAELEAKYRTLVEQMPAIVYLSEYGQEG